ncbi:alpha/beta fold hydrolase [Gordonia sp. NPDC127522]|uniref:alpha/beta fold hydrolase n=1 Tax=Gordonia sp. NPDC127522 TaxID=3345390 RepID=UPI003640B1CD
MTHTATTLAHHEISTEKGVLRYQVTGDGPPLLLLHGSGPGVTGLRNFGGNLPRFAEHFTCYVVDFPGFGVSDDFGGHPMVTALDAVETFVDSTGLSTVSIIGNSMGGGIALNYAAEHPERVSRIVSIGGVGKALFGPTPTEGIKLLQEFTDSPTRERLVRWLHSMVFDPDMVTDELVEERWSQATEPRTLDSARRMYSSAAFAAMMQSMENSATPPPWSMLHKVQAPTLLAWGRDDRVTPLDMALVPLRTIPDVELHVFSRCGHWAMIEQKAAFEDTSLAFLQR